MAGKRTPYPLKALRDLLGENKVNYVQALAYSRDKSEAGFAAAVAAARRSDAILFFGGEEDTFRRRTVEGEIDMPGAQTELLEALAATGKPVILVVMAGRPLAIGRELDLSDAVCMHGMPTSTTSYN
ncbi:MAG: glycoside hydrolase family 3 C-terminal domain-containing protein [Bacteroidales bacterium]|nr:glycoside hydrolase family 3 C-terminal domain-containing protein [Bacteroidales bacterium]